MTATFVNVLYECLEGAWYTFVNPTHCGMLCHCSTSRRSNSGNVAAGKGYKSCARRSRLSQGWSIGDGSGSRRPVQGVHV